MTADPAQTTRRELGDLSREIIAVFDGGLTQVATIRAAAGDLAAEVDDLLEIGVSDEADGAAGGNLFDQFLRRAASVADVADNASTLLCGEDLHDTVRLLLSNLSVLGKRTIELRMISSLTKVARTESEDLDRRLGAFVQTLDGRSDDLRRISSKSSEAVSTIWSASERAGEGLRAMSGNFRKVSTSTRDEAARLQDLEAAHREHVLAVRDARQKLAENVRGSVARLIDCLQFPDAFAQRAEHVGAILAALGDGRPTAEQAAMAKLAGAQMQAMSEALEQVTGNAAGAVSAVLRALEGDLAADQVPGRNPSLAYLEAATRANATMLAAADAARTRLDMALGQVSDVQTRIDAAIEALEASSALNKRLENAAHNAAIAASHFGSSTSPLHVLAGSVKAAVSQTSELTGTLSVGLQRFRDASRKLEQADLQGELAALVDMQERARAFAGRQSADVADFQRLQDEVAAKSQTIARAAEAAGAAFEAAGGRGPKLRELAHEVARLVAAPAECIDYVDLGWIEALYTMEDERAVHRALFPSSHVATPSESVIDEEELDDFLL